MRRVLALLVLALAACRSSAPPDAAPAETGDEADSAQAAPAGDRAPDAASARATADAARAAADAVPPEGIGPFDAGELRLIYQHSPLPEPPPDPTNAWADRADAAHFGQFLFFDQRLSGAGDVSCATCHVPDRSWSDGRRLSIAAGAGKRHTQSLWNVAYNRWFFWDGRADSLWAQALGPLEAETEHAGSRLQYVHLVAEDPDLRTAYESIFGPLPDVSDPARFPREGRPVPLDARHPHDVAWKAMAQADRVAVDRVFANLGKAIAAYERRILSRDAPFDRFVRGLRSGSAHDRRWLSASAQRGLKLFVGEGNCRLCHLGPNFTDLEFHNTRVAPLRGRRPQDSGRYGGLTKLLLDRFNGLGDFSDDTGKASHDKLDYLVRSGHDWGEFKTPSLRNVATTAPYMHQGQLDTLDAVVRHYSTFEGALPPHDNVETTLVPLELEPDEVCDLVAFLESLTDTLLDPALLVQPESPIPPQFP